MLLIMRSFLSAETSFNPFHWKVAEKPAEAAVSLEASFDVVLPTEHISWESEFYFNDLQKLSLEKTVGLLPEFKKRIEKDALSFFKEFGAFQSIISYPNYSPFGIEGGYSSSDVVERCIAFAKLQERLGLPAERAWLDVDVQKHIRNWMLDKRVQPDSWVISFSPRGTELEGYPGKELKYYNCLHPCRREQDLSTTFTQYDSWDTTDQLEDLQRSLAAKGTLVEVPIKHRDPTVEHQLLARYVVLPPGALRPPLPGKYTSDELTEMVMLNKETWAENPDVISPKIQEEKLARTTSALSQLVAQEFEKIVTAQLYEKSGLKDPKKASAELNLLVQTIRLAMKRWSHDSAENINEKDKKLTEMASPEYMAELIKAWKAECKAAEGTATEQDQALLTQFKLSVTLPDLSPIHRAASLAHCIAGTPVSLGMQISQLQNLSLNGVNGLSINGIAFNEQERSKYLEDLKRMIRIEVHGEVWYVPTDYLADPGCYWDPELKCVVGPCGIPLSQDPYAQTEAEYTFLLNQLMNDEFASDSELNVSQKQSAISLLDSLQVKLCKASIGLDSLINNNFAISDAHMLGPFLQELHQEMSNSDNPLYFLKRTVRTLVVTNQQHVIEILEEECTTDYSQDVEVDDIDLENAQTAFSEPASETVLSEEIEEHA